MFVERKFNCTGKLQIKRSKLLSKEVQPKDDIVSWLFLKVGKYQFSFVYRIHNPDVAEYDKPFKIDLVFTMEYDKIFKYIELNKEYIVARGEEEIGVVSLEYKEA